MTAARTFEVFRVEAAGLWRRPLFWFLAATMILTAFGMSKGVLSVSSGSSQVGGTKAWITSEFAIAQIFGMLTLLFYGFFVAVAAGMIAIADEENKVEEVLHSSPLTPAEYVWGKLSATLVGFLAIVVVHVFFSAFFNHLVPAGSLKEIRGPFALAHYAGPAIAMALPVIFFIACTTFAVGEMSRKAILVFFLPVAVVLVCGFFLWNWSPTWLDPRINRVLMILDPSAFRWLSETYLKVDRGVHFYNTASIHYDATFWINRAWVIGASILSALAAQRHLARSVRGAARRVKKGAAPVAAPVAASSTRAAAGLRALGMSVRVPSFVSHVLVTASTELRELRSQPGLYLFVPLILLQTLGTSLTLLGAFDTPVLLTPGMTAVRAANTLTLLVCLLLTFYTVESIEREERTRLAQISYATPMRTAAMLFGKALANSVVALAVLAAAFVGSAIALLIQGTVPLSLTPFVLVWGVLLVPTFFFWASFVMALRALTGNRYVTYALAIGLMCLTGYLQLTGKLNWVGNWNIWAVIRWSDVYAFAADRSALLLNRIMVTGAAVFFVAFAVRVFARREADGSRAFQRLQPGPLARSAMRLAPYAVVPIVAGSMLGFQVSQGFQGGAAKKAQKDYWRRNVETWLNATYPDIARLDVDVNLFPDARRLRSAGTLVLVNRRDSLVRQVPLTLSAAAESASWTMNGARYTPENRSGLYVFTPPRAMRIGDTLRLGWRFENTVPKGISKNGANTGQFVFPAAVVLTQFEADFVPRVGFLEDVGIDKDNRHEPRDYPEDFYAGTTRAAFGGGQPFPARVRVTVPSGWDAHAVGTLDARTERGDRVTYAWSTEHPVNFVNIIASPSWKVRRGHGTAIYYFPQHPYNIDSMTVALDAARRYYSEWFTPFPWNELRVSEFPGLAGYAQGFPTNITFSENIGFLTKNEPKADATFLVTAHESAHQWWGNIILPGAGPSGDILSEGMAHFSTALLFEQVRGPRARMEFMKRLESRYGEQRNADEERSIVRTDFSKPTDRVTEYEKGGWVNWMLYDFMGRERALAGIREFIALYRANPDHPVVPDYLAVMRRHATDPVAFDRFVRPWFYEVVVPEYRLTDAKRVGAHEVSVKVTNAGTGRFPVVIAATSGERFPDPKKAKKKAAAYRDARTVVELGPNESRVVRIRCDGFTPEKVIVDPDVTVLQLQRKSAVASL